MHAYDVPGRSPLPSIPSARDPQAGPSATPIYDRLYSEWVKSFRTLPGDRSGEEDLGFTAFGSILHSTGSYGGHRPGTFSSSYSAYRAGAFSARSNGGQHHGQWQRVGPLTPHTTGLHPVPALPPGPRQGG
ncbi:hypothetical protein [Streptomyces sp. NPDC054794]